MSPNTGYGEPGWPYLLCNMPFVSNKKFNIGDQRDWFRAADMPLKFVNVVTGHKIFCKHLQTGKQEQPIHYAYVNCSGIFISPYHILTCAHGNNNQKITDSTKQKLAAKS